MVGWKRGTERKGVRCGLCFGQCDLVGGFHYIKSDLILRNGIEFFGFEATSGLHESVFEM